VRKTKTRNLYRMIIGVLMVISGLISMIFASDEAIAGTILLIAGITFLLTGIFRHKKYGDEPESDERLKKIGAYGLSYAWLTGILFISALYWLDYLNIVKLGTQIALALSIVVLALSAVAYHVYLFRKGDVE
jgi:hypothetical protein